MNASSLFSHPSFVSLHVYDTGNDYIQHMVAYYLNSTKCVIVVYNLICEYDEIMFVQLCTMLRTCMAPLMLCCIL